MNYTKEQRAAMKRTCGPRDAQSVLSIRVHCLLADLDEQAAEIARLEADLALLSRAIHEVSAQRDRLRDAAHVVLDAVGFDPRVRQFVHSALAACEPESRPDDHPISRREPMRTAHARELAHIVSVYGRERVIAAIGGCIDTLGGGK